MLQKIITNAHLNSKSMSPNLLFIYTDEQRFDTLAAYGNDRIAMPNLNRLADQSCVFDRATVTQPVCTPSRSSLLTGLYPHRNGCTANNLLLDDTIPCLPELLPAGHYATAHFGKWHLGDELFAQHGFDHWLSIEDGYNAWFRPGRDQAAVSDYTRWLLAKGRTPKNGHDFNRDEAAALPEALSKPAFLAEAASRFIREHHDRPFCLYVNFLEPHMPFTGPRDGQYDPDAIPLPENFDNPPAQDQHLRYRLFHAHYAAGRKFGVHSDNPDEVRRLIARYWGLCSQVDTHCGTILDTLADAGLWDDTIIVFTSDHGDMMGAHQLIAKCVMYEEAVRVPMLVKLPGQRTMRRIDGPVSQVDLVPTLLEAMGQPVPAHLHGVSRLGSVPRDTDGVVVEWNGANNGVGADLTSRIELPEDMLQLASRATIEAAITDPIRTIYSPDGRWKLSVSPLGDHELYDLASDPGECRNRVGAPATGDVVADLQARLRRWQERTGDTVSLPEYLSTHGCKERTL